VNRRIGKRNNLNAGIKIFLKGVIFMVINKTVQQIFDKGIELSKKTYEKAKELGEIGLIQVEIIALQHKMAKKIGQLGTLTYNHLLKEKAALRKDTKGVPAILKEIKDLGQKIKQKEKELKDKNAK
jgi:hypothetical protein